MFYFIIFIWFLIISKINTIYYILNISLYKKGELIENDEDRFLCQKKDSEENKIISCGCFMLDDNFNTDFSDFYICENGLLCLSCRRTKYLQDHILSKSDNKLKKN